MKLKLCLAGFLLALFIIGDETAIAQAPNWIWAKSTGSSGYDQGRAIATDTLGNVYVAGYFQDVVDFDPGPNIVNLVSAGGVDVFVSKFDSSGSLDWVKQMGGTGDDYCYSMAVDLNANIYLTGLFMGTADFDPGVGFHSLITYGPIDVFICKLDNLGNYVWAKNMGGAGCTSIGQSVAIDASGNVCITGNFSGTVDFDPNFQVRNLVSSGAWDVFIAKYNNSGNYLWAKGFGGLNNDVGSSVVFDASDNVYTTGYFSTTVDFNPGSGVFNLTSNGSYEDIFISKLDGLGSFIWAKKIGGSAEDIGHSISIGRSGSNSVYLTGSYQGTVDFDPGPAVVNSISNGDRDIFISKFDGAGNFAWSKSIGGIDSDIGYFISTDEYDNIYSTGQFGATVDFDPGNAINNMVTSGFSDVFIQRLDSLGNFGWSMKIGGVKSEVGHALAIDSYNQLFITGEFHSLSLSAGTTVMTNSDVWEVFPDIFMARLDNTITAVENVNPGNGFFAYPNPVHDYFIITGHRFSDISRIEIYNSVGAKLKEKDYQRKSMEVAIDVSDLPSGFYFAKVITAKDFGTVKFIKE